MPEPFSATAPVKSLPGTAAKPGVTFTGDEDTGLYRSGANELAVAVGGAEAAKFTATQTSLKGDINLDDGGTYTTTLQVISQAANETITQPAATGISPVLAGSTTLTAYAGVDGGFYGALPYSIGGGRLEFSNALGFNPADGTLSCRTFSSLSTTSPTIAGNTTFTGRFINSVANAASAPAGLFSGQWFTTGTSTTTKPAVNIEQSGATSTGWSTAGTGLGVNSASTFAGRLLDLQKNATSKFSVSHEGNIAATGDLNLDDGGSFQTTLQLVTPTAARTITFPDATGTVALVGGSSGNLVVNQSGAYAGVANSSVDNATGNITLGSRFISSLNGAASAPPGTFTGTWFTGGTATTTKPQVLIEPTGATSTAWSTAGTGLGINAASGFGGRLLDLQLNGTSNFNVDSTGRTSFPLGTAALPALYPGADTNTGIYSPGADQVAVATNGSERLRITSAGLVGIGTSGPIKLLDVYGDSGLIVRSTNRNATETPIFVGGGDNNQRKLALIGKPAGSFGRQDLLICSNNVEDSTDVTSANAVVTVKSTGQVGIGTTSPSSLLHLADAGDITVGTTTGTKIGTATTQKLGFYNATPVVQPAAVADATDAATVITQLNDLLAKLRTLGIIAT
jgi:hypothetical protein